MGRGIVGVGLLLVAVGAAGCKGLAGRDAPIELAVSVAHRVADVPVPAGFSLDESRSFRIDSPIIVYHVYRGFRVSRHDVVRFYEKQMPVARWQPIGRVEAGGRRLLAFERDGEKCLIHVRKRSPLWTRLTIEVVGPAVPTAG